jgi:hypothetical protein
VNRDTSALVIGSVAIAVLALWRAGDLLREPLPTAPAPAAWTPSEIDLGSPRNSIQATTMVRPLFSRQQDAGDGAGARSGQAGSAPPSQNTRLPRLVGVVAEGDRRIAIVAYKGAILRVGEKGNIGEWTMVRIEPRSALVRGGARSEMLWLDAGSAKAVESMVESQ